jgi:phage/plasmid-associated DNA primase
LAWAVAGAIKWYASSLQEPAAITETTERQRVEQDTVGQFLEEMWEATEHPNDFVCNPEFYESYQQYCVELGVKPKGLNQLTQSLRSKGIKAGEVRRVGGRPTRGVAGLRWKGSTIKEKAEEKL